MEKEQILEIIIAALILVIVSLTVYIIVYKAKKKTEFEISKADYDKALATERSLVEKYISLNESQEASYQELSKTNLELQQEANDAKARYDAVHDKNIELNTAVAKLTSETEDLEGKVVALEKEIAAANATKEAERKKEAAVKASKHASEDMKREELLQLAKEKGLTGVSKKSKAELVELLKN